MSRENAFHCLLEIAKPKRIVEVGTWLGESCFLLMQLAKERGMKPEILCIDTWLGSWEHWNKNIPGWGIESLLIEKGEPQLFKVFLAAVSESEFRNQISWLRCPAQSSGKYLEKYFTEANLVYIDGDHSTESVFGDLGVLYRCYPNALIAGDDFVWLSVRLAIAKFAFRNNLHIYLAQDKTTWALARTSDVSSKLRTQGWVKKRIAPIMFENKLIRTKTFLKKLLV